MKNIAHFTNFYIWASSLFEDASANVNRLLEATFIVFQKFPPEALKHVKNIPLYIDYLEAMKALFNFVNFTLKRMPMRAPP